MLTRCSFGKSTRRFCTSTSNASIAILRWQLRFFFRLMLWYSLVIGFLGVNDTA